MYRNGKLLLNDKQADEEQLTVPLPMYDAVK